MSNQLTNHIWQYKDLDTNTTSVCYVEKKHIVDMNFFISKIKDIELETKCLINLHGVESQKGIVWIRIKNQCPDLRSFAILLINSYTQNSIKEIVLPKMEKKTCSITKKKTLTRSCTDYSIASVVCSNPFGSILSPFMEENTIEVKQNTKETNLFNRDIQRTFPSNEFRNRIENKKQTKRYTLDFLLSRSIVAESKKIPKNWKELNIMYPNICFIGTVLSYFNASKYYDHWFHIQSENPELHDPVESLTNIQYLNLSQDKCSKLDLRKKKSTSLIKCSYKNTDNANINSKTKVYDLFINPKNKTDISFLQSQYKNKKK